MTTMMKSAADEIVRVLEDDSLRRLYASDVIAAVRQTTRLDDEQIRFAIWQLISEGRLELTDDRALVLPKG